MAKSKRKRTNRAKSVWIGEAVPMGVDAELVVWVDRASGDTIAEAVTRTARVGDALLHLFERAIEDGAKAPALLSVGGAELARYLRQAVPGIPVSARLDSKALTLVENAAASSAALDDPIELALDGGEPVYTIEVTLRDVEPVVWRRIRVAANASLNTLHAVLQVAMGWENCHLHQFRIGDTDYGMSDEDVAPDVVPEESALIGDVLADGGSAEYWYDFGDDWMHDLVVEQVSAARKGDPIATCVDGARACPPEDSGGPHGYADKLRAMTNPESDWDQELRDWMGDFDPEAFDVEGTNDHLRLLFEVGGNAEAVDSDYLTDPDYLDDLLDDGFEPAYDAEQSPDPSAWLELEEGEQIVHVGAYHRLHDDDHARSLQMHAILHVIVENQLLMEDPPEVRRAFDRVQREGLSRHEAIHAIGTALAPLMLQSMDDGRFDEAAYARELDTLTADRWRAIADDEV